VKLPSNYDPKAVDSKWRKLWRDRNTFAARDPQPGDKTFFVLDMFPYPSGSGLHVGHPVGYLATDIVARYKRMRGFHVLYPMGWDAFGLPAEQHAIKTGEHPKQSIAKNIQNFRRQMDLLGLSYDWDREINTTDPKYYRWTQRIFVALYNAWFDPAAQKARPIEELPIPADVAAGGPLAVQEYQSRYRLVYFNEAPVNWCPELGTVLANEEVFDGKSEQGFDVIRIPKRQVILRITAFAERLLAGLEKLDWPEGIKELQRNWIGKTTGAEVRFPIAGDAGHFAAFTTRPETLAGVTFVAIAPEHPRAAEIVTPECRAAVTAYIEAAQNKSDLARKKGTEKTGVDTGRFVTNPLTGTPVPIFVADYVLAEHGTGVVMGVPAHDDRDFDFAQKYNLPVVAVIAPKTEPERSEVIAGTRCWLDEGEMLPGRLPADMLDAYKPGSSVAEGFASICKFIEAKGLGKVTTYFRIRDWIFARQRYWGEPIPLIHWEDGIVESLKPDQLPLELPHLDNFKPSGDGESALARATDWVNVTDPATGRRGRRETSTMPQWAGSCWYPLRYMDPRNDHALVDPAKEKAWGAADLYIGGAEHATLHLLYSRFWYLAMHDLGLIQTAEPFRKLVNQGMLVSYAYQNAREVVLPVDEVEEPTPGEFVHKPSGEKVERVVAKMSKSLRNVVNPDDVIERYGSDAFRLHLMFMGPVEGGRVWETDQVGATFKFLRRVWALVTENNPEGAREMVPPEAESPQVKGAINTLIQNITEDMEKLRFNTGVSELMKFVNAAEGEALSRDTLEKFVKVLNPLAPHTAEELWFRLGHVRGVSHESWPVADTAALDALHSTVEVVIQVQGRKRGVLTAVRSDTPDDVLAEATRVWLREDGRYASAADGKVIVVRDKAGRLRLVNVVGGE
jgi:leucyl-tRNA synthetase